VAIDALTEEQEPWWCWPENVVIAAEWAVSRGADGKTVFSLFQTPWEHSDIYEQAIEAHLDHWIHDGR